MNVITDIFEPVVDGAPGSSEAADVESHDAAGVVIALVSLVMLALGLCGLVVSVPALSGVGLCLFTLFGFGSALLSLQGVRGWRLISLSAPLSVALVFITGGLMVNLGVWIVSGPLYWLAAAATAIVHVRTLRHSDVLLDLRPGAHRTRPWDLGDLQEGILLNGFSRESRRNVRIVTVLVGLGVITCLASALTSRNLDPGWGGLLVSISPAWYVGLLLIATSIFFGQRGGAILAGVPVVALQLMLTMTPAIVYNNPRYPWSIKHVGVTAYILLHGSVNPSIDIYQAWPGLFSGVAWMCKVAGMATPLGVAQWWPAVIDLATLLAIHQLATRVLRNPRKAWLAATIFVVGYAIGDSDYYSPQSAAFLLAIASFAVVFRHEDERPVMTNASWVVLLSASVADAISHQLTPYMVTAAFAVLVLFKRVNTKWAPVISLAPAGAWAAIHLSYVNQHVSWRELLNPFSNLLTPGIASAAPPPSSIANTVRLFQGGSALLIGLLALLALFRLRSKLNVALAVCAASAGALVFANSYGNEAAFRVVLFALPWLSILVGSLTMTPRSWSAILWPLSVFVLLAVYLVADLGLDFAYAVRPGDVRAINAFETTATYGSYMVVIGQPEGDLQNLTGRYDQVNETSYPYVLGKNPARPLSPAASFEQFLVKFPSLVRSVPSPVVGRSPQYFVMFAQQPAAYLAEYNYATLKEYSAFEAQLAASPLWKLVLSTPSSQLYQLLEWPGGAP